MTSEWLSTVFGATVQIDDTQRIGDGLVGMNLRLVLKASGAGAEQVPRSIVVKLPSPDETSRATGIALRNYEREVKFYTEIAPTVDIRVPRCYHAEWDAADGDFVIVLEDLAPAAQGDQVDGCSVEHSRTAVLELARLHGPRWDDPTLADIEFLGRRTSPDDTALLAAMWSMLFPGFVATYAKYLTPDAAALVERFGSRIGDWIDGRHSPLTVTHGDYRLDNLMFATAEGGSPIATVDWQSPGHGPAMGDVSYFLGAGPLPADRRVIERDLVAAYAAALRHDYGVEIDDDWAWQQYRREAFSGVIMAVIASQIVGGTERSEAMFAAMATRHLQHALDLDSESLI
ncbi:unannotated protein [freshwater metagenome]|uniref:Unannotated protein n=1 Tax=freshwater metagenome TaxID=449393 RepID=A0A6J7EN35_9ZZZZ